MRCSYSVSDALLLSNMLEEHFPNSDVESLFDALTSDIKNQASSDSAQIYIPRLRTEARMVCSALVVGEVKRGKSVVRVAHEFGLSFRDVYEMCKNEGYKCIGGRGYKASYNEALSNIEKFFD
ncbi:hypothetical protein [Vibrio parahaemolyticus]|uniref:hypothetical protein n=1 Tax=Vibrio parahaemolyticus TaxID=670 RepID=UPI00235F7F54|nr:hypothetical protein [Vibrio parahaemolyticus]